MEKILKTFVYIADEDKPSNTKGVLVGCIQDGDEGIEIWMVVGKTKAKVKVGLMIVEHNGQTVIQWDDDGVKNTPCRLETEPFEDTGIEVEIDGDANRKK